MKLLNRIVFLTLGAALFIVGCADGPVAPAAPDLALTQAAAKNGNGPSHSVDLLQWMAPLAEDVSVSAECVPNQRCVLEIDAVGAKLVVPTGSLLQATTITMTALAGSDVNLVFAPHGTVFANDVKIKVDQNKTNSGGSTRFTAHYWVNDVSNIVQHIPARIRNGKISFRTNHFSGYALGM